MEFIFESTPLMYTGVFVFGLLIGSFLNVVIYRTSPSLNYDWHSQCLEFLHSERETGSLPTGIFFPNDECPHCHHLLESGKKAEDPPPGIFFSQTLCPHCDELPILGYRLIAGKCSECGKSIPRKVSPSRSVCRKCGHKIKALENIPVLSFIFLKGKCSGCDGKISSRYPFVELVTAVAFTISIWHFGPSLQGLAAIIFSTALIVLTGIDFDTQLLPDHITLPLMWVGIALNFNNIFTDIHSSLLGVAGGYLVLWGFAQAFKQIRGKEGMGHGDFKLMAALGAWLGWEVLPAIIAISSVLGTIVGITYMAIGQRERDEPLPFGPFIAIAGWVMLIWGDQISKIYLGSGVYG